MSLGFEFMRKSHFYNEEEESDEVSSVFSCLFGVYMYPTWMSPSLVTLRFCSFEIVLADRPVSE